MKVLIGIPAWYNFHYSVIQRCYELELLEGWTKEILATTGYNAAQCKNKTVEYAIENNFDLIFFNDGDNIPVKNVIIKLYNSMLNNNCNIISGVYRQKVLGNMNFSFYDPPYDINLISMGQYTPKRSPVVKKWCNSNYPKKSFRVGAAGNGCMLSKIEVFDKIRKPYFHFLPTENEDIYFSESLMIAGIDFWCDGSIYSKHLKSIMV